MKNFTYSSEMLFRYPSKVYKVFGFHFPRGLKIRQIRSCFIGAIAFGIIAYMLIGGGLS